MPILAGGYFLKVMSRMAIKSVTWPGENSWHTSRERKLLRTVLVNILTIKVGLDRCSLLLCTLGTTARLPVGAMQPLWSPFEVLAFHPVCPSVLHTTVPVGLLAAALHVMMYRCCKWDATSLDLPNTPLASLPACCCTCASRPGKEFVPADECQLSCGGMLLRI